MTRMARSRRDAITILLLTGNSRGSVDAVFGFSDARNALGIKTRSKAEILAGHAWDAVTTEDLVTDALEAAALLRAGWSPGDPVVRRAP